MRGDRVLASLALVVGLAGAAARSWYFALRRPLWLDECMLALNIASRSALDLLRPLDYNQAAPPLFLWIERAAVRLGGVREPALRAWPLAAGVLLIALVWPIARRLAGTPAALAAVALAAFSPTLVRYTDEAKPYGTDALLTGAVVLAVLFVAEAPSRRRWLALAAMGLVAVLASIPATFALAGAVAALALHPAVRRDRFRALAACALVWALAVALLYLSFYRPEARNPHHQEGYGFAFLTPGPGFADRAGLAWRGTILPTFAGNGSVIPDASRTVLTMLTVALAAGAVVVARQHGAWAAVLLVAPLLAAVAASALRRYPLGVPRLMMFASPLLVLMAAASIGWLAGLVRDRWRTVVAIAATAVVAVPMATGTWRALRAPWRGEDAPALLKAFDDRPRTGEPVYIGARAIPSWIFYTTNWEKPNRDRLEFYARAAGNGPSFENGASRLRFVYDEGNDLVFRYHDRREILGLFSGRQWRWPTYQGTADPGWAANEAARIAREANPCAWLYLTHTSENTYRPITWYMRDTHGGRRDVQLVVPGGVLYRYCFPEGAEPVMGRTRAAPGRSEPALGPS